MEELAQRYEVPPSTRKSFFKSQLRTTPVCFEGQLNALLDSDRTLVAFGVGLTRDAVASPEEAGKIVRWWARAATWSAIEKWSAGHSVG